MLYNPSDRYIPLLLHPMYSTRIDWLVFNPCYTGYQFTCAFNPPYNTGIRAHIDLLFNLSYCTAIQPLLQSCIHRTTCHWLIFLFQFRYQYNRPLSPRIGTCIDLDLDSIPTCIETCIQSNPTLITHRYFCIQFMIPDRPLIIMDSILRRFLTSIIGALFSCCIDV